MGVKKLLKFLTDYSGIVRDTKIYDYTGKKIVEDLGKTIFSQRVEEVLSVLKTVFNHDHLYTRGGNSSFVTFDLDDNISLVSNEDDIKGGAVL